MSDDSQVEYTGVGLDVFMVITFALWLIGSCLESYRQNFSYLTAFLLIEKFFTSLIVIIISYR